MADEEQDKEDIGRTINILIAAMGGTARDDPAEAVARYVSPDLRRFKDEDLDILRLAAAREEGIPPFRFLRGGRIRRGGSGIVLQVVNANAQVVYALKFVRPTFMDKPEYRDSAFTVSKKEFLRHAPLSHNNVARILGSARFTEEPPDKAPLAFEAIMMEWIDDATPLLEHLAAICKSPRPELFSSIIKLLTQCFSALGYIHDHGIIHWDIKSDNFLVHPASGVVKLTDFGNSRLLADPARSNFAYTTKGNFPPSLDPFVVTHDETGSSNRTRLAGKEGLPDIKVWDCAWLDMWMLAREVMEIFRSAEEPYRVSSHYRESSALRNERSETIGRIVIADVDRNEYLLECLRVIFRRILVPQSPSENRFYANAYEVTDDLTNLEPEFGAAQGVTELWAVPQKIMRLPVSGNLPFPTRIAKLFDSKVIDRLSEHRQLGSIYQVYKGGMHVRSEHVAGVLYCTIDYVRALFADQTSPFWRLNISRRDVELLLVASFIHDIGHIAFGHYVEEMEGLLGGRTHENYLLAVLKPLKFRAAARWARSREVSSDRSILISILCKNWGAPNDDAAGKFLADVAGLLETDDVEKIEFDSNAIYDRSSCEIIKRHVLRSVLNSAIDADKLDYLLRDALHCGVQYAGGIDTDRFFQGLTVIWDLSRLKQTGEDDEAGEGHVRRTPCIGVSEKGIMPLESVLFARYQLFRSVYWQHTVRAQTAMLQFLIAEFLYGHIAECDQRVVRIDRLLDSLVHNFREKSDEEAIKWLKGELKAIADDRMKNMLRNICDCLLRKRDNLYRQIFELNYERQEEAQRYTLYKSLSDWSQSINENPNGSSIGYLEAIRAKRNEITVALATKLSVPLHYGEILLDVPPAGKDQVDDVFVAFDDEVRSIHDVSPIGNAVRATFAKWTRSVRIFMDPLALERCYQAGKTRRMLSMDCRLVLDEVQNPQRSLI